MTRETEYKIIEREITIEDIQAAARAFRICQRLQNKLTDILTAEELRAFTEVTNMAGDFVCEIAEERGYTVDDLMLLETEGREVKQ